MPAAYTRDHKDSFYFRCRVAQAEMHKRQTTLGVNDDRIDTAVRAGHGRPARRDRDRPARRCPAAQAADPAAGGRRVRAVSAEPGAADHHAGHPDRRARPDRKDRRAVHRGADRRGGVDRVLAGVRRAERPDPEPVRAAPTLAGRRCGGRPARPRHRRCGAVGDRCGDRLRDRLPGLRGRVRRIPAADPGVRAGSPAGQAVRADRVRCRDRRAGRGVPGQPLRRLPAADADAAGGRRGARRGGARDFAWNWVSRLLVGVAYVGVQTFAVFFLTDTAGMTTEAAAGEYARITAISTPLSIACFLLSGFLSDRLGRRRAFVVVGAGLIAAGLVVAAMTQSVSGFLIAWLVLTVGQSIYLTVDIAIAAAVVPDDAQAGKAMSVYQVATVLPNIVAPVAAVAVLTISGGANYPAFFAVLAAGAVLAAVAVQFVRRIR